jgi:P27 family predicted phage terminase small subunit
MARRPRLALAPPDDLHPDALRAWTVIVKTLDQAEVLDGVDVMALEACCTQWARAKDAARIIRADGPTATGSTGQVVEHPAVATERNAHSMFLRYAEQLALTPAARLGLQELQKSLSRHEDNDPFADLDAADELAKKRAAGPRRSRKAS